MRNRDLNLALAQLDEIADSVVKLRSALQAAHESELGYLASPSDEPAVSGSRMSDPTARLALNPAATRSRDSVRSALKSIKSANIEIARAQYSIAAAFKAADPHRGADVDARPTVRTMDRAAYNDLVDSNRRKSS
jgi:hypothetical protein